MRYKHFILLTTEVFSIVESAFAPDIKLDGKLISNNDSKVLQLTCSTNIAVQLCSVEFLINKKTFDIIRYFDSNCYHSMWICSPSICTCSDDCMSFTRNVKETQDIINHSYSCASRIEKEGVIYLANITVLHDGNGGFNVHKKIVVPYSSVRSTTRATTLSPETSTGSFLSAPLIIAGVASGFLSCILLVVVLLMICRRNWNSKTDKDRTTNYNTQCDQQSDSPTAKYNGLGTPNHHILKKDENTERNNSTGEVFKVQAEIIHSGTRLSVASSNQSDNRSLDLLIDSSSKTNVVTLHKHDEEKHESTYI